MKEPDIIFEDKDMVVINKLAGLLSVPDRIGLEPSLKLMLAEKYGTIFTVHRLDRGTSGLIVFAKNESAHKYLSGIFEGRLIEKIYLGIVTGSLKDKKGSIDLPIMEHPSRNAFMVVNKKGKSSLTSYEVMEEFGLYSLLRFTLHTGRTHQIRVHIQQLGHPIVCDELYGSAQPILVSSFKKKYKLSKSEESERPILQRLGLHAHQLQFAGPDGKLHQFEAALPKDMRALLQQLRKK